MHELLEGGDALVQVGLGGLGGEGLLPCNFGILLDALRGAERLELLVPGRGELRPKAVALGLGRRDSRRPLGPSYRSLALSDCPRDS
jgi:hypothetical protein